MENMLEVGDIGGDDGLDVVGECKGDVGVEEGFLSMLLGWKPEEVEEVTTRGVRRSNMVDRGLAQSRSRIEQELHEEPTAAGGA